MRTRLEIVKAYGRYLESLKKQNSNVVAEFDKMYKYIINEVEKVDEKLWRTMCIDCPNKALQVAMQRKLRFKENGYDWNQYAVDKCFKLIDNINKADETNDLDTYKINLYKLFKLLREDEAPNVILYMWYTYKKTDSGKVLLKSENEKVRKLLNASTEEEIEDILKE